MPWSMIIDQANAAAESNGRYFNKTNPFESIRPKRIGESIRITNRNALMECTSGASLSYQDLGCRRTETNIKNEWADLNHAVIERAVGK